MESPWATVTSMSSATSIPWKTVSISWYPSGRRSRTRNHRLTFACARIRIDSKGLGKLRGQCDEVVEPELLGARRDCDPRPAQRLLSRSRRVRYRHQRVAENLSPLRESGLHNHSEVVVVNRRTRCSANHPDDYRIDVGNGVEGPPRDLRRDFSIPEIADEDAGRPVV